MGMHRAVGGCVLVMCLLAMLVERTDGHITFFSPKEMRDMLERQREGRKGMEPRSEDGQMEEAILPHPAETVIGGSPDKTIEIAVRLTAKQLNHLTPVLEEIIREIAEEQEKAK